MPPRPIFDWRLRTRTLPLGRRTLILGILNITPDSFSDGGHFYSIANETERALTHALQMLDEGADILDIGGESTRPNAIPLTPAEEQSRILPVIDAILKERPEAILSIDTYHASTAMLAIGAGAEIINDVSGHTWDPAMSATCAQLQCGAILTHCRGTPQTWKTLPQLAPDEILPIVLTGLTEILTKATAAGIPQNKVVLDPGLGFGKLGSANFTLLANLAQLHQLHQPILIGASRKRFLRQAVSNESPATNLGAPGPASGTWAHATTAANVCSILSGAHLLRVHEIRPAREAATIADAILAAS
jgi:dihydropteroate synthase